MGRIEVQPQSWARSAFETVGSITGGTLGGLGAGLLGIESGPGAVATGAAGAVGGSAGGRWFGDKVADFLHIH